MKNLHKILSNEPTKKGDIAVGITLKIWDGEGNAPQHSYNLYITNDEAIANEDWVTNGREVFKKSDVPNMSLEYANRYLEKIILTTDRLLIEYGIQPIPNDFLEWYVDNPRCEQVEVKMENYYASGALQPNLWQYKIVNQKEEPTLEEAARKYANIIHNRPLDDEERYYKDYQKYDGFIAGAKSDAARDYWYAKWKQQDSGKDTADYIDKNLVQALVEIGKTQMTFVPDKRMYSEEEVVKLWNWLNDGFMMRKSLPTREELIGWFEQHKKTT